MYYPFLRGKKEELAAVTELISLIKDSGNVIPIIEPMNLNTTTVKFFKKIIENEIDICIVMNSKLISESENEKLFTLFVNKNIVPAFIINSEKDINEYDLYKKKIIKNKPIMPIVYQECEGLENVITKDGAYKYVLYKDKISPGVVSLIKTKSEVILLDDPFVPAAKNADYQESEYYSNNHNDYKKNGYSGFSDYQMIGRRIAKGGPAYAVAIHWTCFKKNGQMWIYHFVSDEKNSTANVQGKYLQSLRKMVAFYAKFENHIETLAAIDYRKNNEDKMFHGLGFPKRISIKNHIELVGKK